MAFLTVGVIGTSLKENERRVAIHPDHLDLIGDEVRKHLVFEKGYGDPFSMDDERIAAITSSTKTRDEIFEKCDIVLIPKPVQKDLDMMKKNGILWGWAHLVQQESLTQTAIERKLTVITWESMNTWGPNGDWQMHIFYKNNEIAGYAGVQHALGLSGSDGNYGPSRKAVVINFGSVARGAVYALQGRGFNDITVFTPQPCTRIADQIPGIEYRQMKDQGSGSLCTVKPDGTTCPFIDELSIADIIVNGMLQDPDNPLMFVRENEIDRLKPGCLIIDISCDAGMGFSFAEPTTFANPVRNIGTINYYAVDHTPSYLWNSASWEISKAIIPFMQTVIKGPAAWDRNETIRRAVEVRSGVIENPKILSFQKRSPEYPHPVTSD